MNNKFEIALERNELNQFIKGENDYFVLDREYGGHWSYGNFTLYVEPYLDNNNGYFANHIWETVMEAMSNEKDINLFVDHFVGLLIPYFSDSNLVKKRREAVPEKFISYFAQCVSRHKDTLKNDRRGTGAVWNSNNGIWSSLLDNLETIKKRGGPDFVTPILTI